MTLQEALTHLHNHPKMEARLGLPPHHVIIDIEVYMALKQLNRKETYNEPTKRTHKDRQRT